MSLQTKNNFAFKEWASIVYALASGKQILILRKSGIREETGEFQMEHNEFFLFPTYEHQNRSDLKPEASHYLELALEAKPSSNLLPIQYYAKVMGAIQIADERELEHLRPYHIWSDEAIKKRFHYGRRKGLYVIAVRIFCLPSQHVIEVTSDYAGCKSWVELNENLPIADAQPVLPEAAFNQQWEVISASFLRL
ncbi:MAG: DUF1802 family protein [Candidatus Omnitrophica bacterium]|nr:DUF1802 family protein [Candidatus Omnitrophota bacterium]